jgi:hypothetical protein
MQFAALSLDESIMRNAQCIEEATCLGAHVALSDVD